MRHKNWERDPIRVVLVVTERGRVAVEGGEGRGGRLR